MVVWWMGMALGWWLRLLVWKGGGEGGGEIGRSVGLRMRLLIWVVLEWWWVFCDGFCFCVCEDQGERKEAEPIVPAEGR